MNFFIQIYDQFTIFLAKSRILLFGLYRVFFVRVYFVFIILINLFLWWGAYFMYSRIGQDVAILHYNVDFGVDLIGHKKYLFLLPLLGLIFILINKIMLLFLIKKDDFKFLSYFLLSFLVLLNIFLGLSLYSVYLINF